MEFEPGIQKIHGPELSEGPQGQVEEVDDVHCQHGDQVELKALIVRGVDLVAEAGVAELVAFLEQGHGQGRKPERAHHQEFGQVKSEISCTVDDFCKSLFLAWNFFAFS